MKARTKRILKRFTYITLGAVFLLVVAAIIGIQYFKAQFFRDTPNRLTIEGELKPIQFQWSSQKYGEFIEPHEAILIPVTIQGVEKKLYMQFDTGSQNTFFRSGAIRALQDMGIPLTIFDDEGKMRVGKFELDVGGNRILLNNGWVRKRSASIDWDNPDSVDIIGSFGTDLLDQKVCAIDFPAQEIKLWLDRPESFDKLGSFLPFEFKGRRIVISGKMNGANYKLFYDSGCSAFGLLTSKYHFDCLTERDAKEISYDANRHGDPVMIHHRRSDLNVWFGETQVSIQRVSYAELYTFAQTIVGRFVRGGFLGNKCLTKCTLILDCQANEFLVVDHTLSTDH